jgi:hypothetical protein
VRALAERGVNISRPHRVWQEANDANNSAAGRVASNDAACGIANFPCGTALDDAPQDDGFLCVPSSPASRALSSLNSYCIGMIGGYYDGLMM